MEGPIHDRLQPTVKALEDILRDVEKDTTNLTSQMLHDPDVKKHQEKMEFLKWVRQGVESNIADVPYLLTEETFENLYMANYADLICLRVVGEEDEKNIRKALEYLYTAMDTHYSKGEYTMLAAAIDCAAVLERKLPEYAFFLGAANEKAYHLPQLAEAGLFHLYKGDETKQVLFHMMSTEAVKVANPKAYAAGECTIKAYDLLKDGYDLASSGTLNYGSVSKRSGKGLPAGTSEYLKFAASFLTGMAVDEGVLWLAERLYEAGMSA